MCQDAVGGVQLSSSSWFRRAMERMVFMVCCRGGGDYLWMAMVCIYEEDEETAILGC